MRCNWCSGTGIVGKIIHGEEPELVDFAGIKLRVCATIADAPCKRCGGTGELPSATEPPIVVRIAR